MSKPEVVVVVVVVIAQISASAAGAEMLSSVALHERSTCNDVCFSIQQYIVIAFLSLIRIRIITFLGERYYST